MRVDFIAPDPDAFVSGGNIYNAGLARGLRANEAEVVFSDDINTAHSPDVSIIDTICFDRLSHAALPGKAIGLIHHLNSLYPMSADEFEESDRPNLDRMDAFIATSQWTANFLSRKGYTRDSIFVTEPVANNLRKKEYRPVTKVRGVMLNNLVERKGVLPFLTDLTKAQIPGYYELHIVGSMTADPDYARICIEFARSDKTLSKTVRFYGAQDDTAVERLMNMGNLFISASRMETFGMAIQEAAVRGLPLLVHEGGNAANHVNAGQNGWKAGDMHTLVDIFGTLVNQPDLLDNMCRNAIAYEATYPTSWDESARQVIAFLRSLP